MNSEFEIRNLNVRSPRIRGQVEAFLSENGLRLDPVDQYFGVFRLEEDQILAGGGIYGDIIKCVAVREEYREEHLFNMLVSHLLSEAYQNGHFSTKVYTKPGNKAIFESLGFHSIGQSPMALFMENSLTNLNKYKSYLNSHVEAQAKTRGLIVMNANPFTKGHRYLVEQASRQVDQLFVIVVKENRSLFDYRYRLEMVRKGCADMTNVQVLEGSDYQISSATFPTYFLKQVTAATDEHIMLDLDVCVKHIVPSLGVTKRFVGSEPTDLLTARYNELMSRTLPMNGVEVVEIARKEQDGKAISASRVRKNADLSLVYPTSVPFVIGVLAADSLRTELNLTPKPGLIDSQDNGAHDDMNYAVMMRSVDALEPFFVEFSQMGYQEALPATEQIVSSGLAAEKAMMEATGGVNTHKGALFAIGLACMAASHCFLNNGSMNQLSATIQQLAESIPDAKGTHGSDVRDKYHVAGALDQAKMGYAQLFDSWLPFYQSKTQEETALHQLLLYIIAELDDNNILYRRGAELAQEVKDRARIALEDFKLENIATMNSWMIKEHLSPGGCADMLALTHFISRLTYNK